MNYEEPVQIDNTLHVVIPESMKDITPPIENYYLLLSMMQSALTRSASAEEFAIELADEYQYPLSNFATYGCRIEEGVWKSDEGDPDIHPYFMVTTPKFPLQVFVYNYSFVAIVGDKPEPILLTRMD